ncbi:MAG: hypothetical protein KAT71_05045 [Gammaproteobacteria bacterium]|nr:hypothetical protein [Gammaproteobacteria bacterium]
MTQLKYLEDFCLAKHRSVCIEISSDEVIVDETIFYPQGGGQPCDTGIITNKNGEFQVTKVYLDENGIVHHLGNFIKGAFNSGDIVDLVIDKERRDLNTRLHSAGHLIDCAVEQLNLNYLKPTKGYHFPGGPSIEYEGAIENPETLLPQLQRAVNSLIAQKLPIQIDELTEAEAKKHGLFVPKGKSARIVGFKGFKACGCGGTHVKNSSEIGKIIIKKIKTKKGITKISYVLD